MSPLTLLAACALVGLPSCPAAAAQTMLVYIGTYSPSAPHHGLHAADFSPDHGLLTGARSVAALADPSFLAIAKDGRTLFSCGATEQADGSVSGGVFSFRINDASGTLTPLSHEPNGTVADCHLALTPDGRTLLAAHYNDGAVAAFPIAADGQILPRSARIQHVGTSVNPARQEGPHVHGVTPSPDGRHLFVPDLGLDRLVAYRLEPGSRLLAEPAADIPTPAGQGPRHAVFSADGRFLYEMDELVACVRVHRYDPTTGQTRFVQQVSSLSAGYAGAHSGAELQLHPSGRWLYASNREDDQSIAVFAVEPTEGTLQPVQHWRPGLVHPRFFTFDPTGRWLLVTNTFGDSVVVAPVDPASGQIGGIVSTLSLPRPSCLVFRP